MQKGGGNFRLSMILSYLWFEPPKLLINLYLNIWAIYASELPMLLSWICFRAIYVFRLLMISSYQCFWATYVLEKPMLSGYLRFWDIYIYAIELPITLPPSLKLSKRPDSSSQPCLVMKAWLFLPVLACHDCIDSSIQSYLVKSPLQIHLVWSCHEDLTLSSSLAFHEILNLTS